MRGFHKLLTSLMFIFAVRSIIHMVNLKTFKLKMKKGVLCCFICFHKIETKLCLNSLSDFYDD